nr:Hypothetical protein FSTVLC9_345 [Faustovirus]
MGNSPNLPQLPREIIDEIFEYRPSAFVEVNWYYHAMYWVWCHKIINSCVVAREGACEYCTEPSRDVVWGIWSCAPRCIHGKVLGLFELDNPISASLILKFADNRLFIYLNKVSSAIRIMNGHLVEMVQN